MPQVRKKHGAGPVKAVLMALSCLAVATLMYTMSAANAGVPPMNLSFQASAGNSAGWVTGPGSPHSEVYLTVNTPGGSFSVVTVHHFPASLPAQEPSFTAINYASGTPRIYIQLNNTDYAFIYPSGSGVYLETIIGGHAYYSMSYADFVTYENGQGAIVTAVFIVADTSQAVPYTAYITSFQYYGDYLIGSE